MKKTLIALAALAATGAFAQVAVTGYIDRAYTSVDNTNDSKDVKSLTSAAGTTTLVFSGTEDLGGGLKAGFSVATDWADLSGANQDSTATTASSIQTGGFANSQSYIELVSGSLGTVRAGTVNNETLTAVTSVASPAFSTGVGSAYSTAFSIHNGYGTGTTGSGGIVSAVSTSGTGAGARGIRQANTIKYISPKFFDGLVVSYGFAPKNDVNAVQNGSTSTIDTVGVTDYSVRYTRGPLDVMYAGVNYEVGTGGGIANGGLSTDTNNRNTILAVTYAIMPTLKLHAGLGSSAGFVESSSRQFGVSYAVTPAIDLMAQMAVVDDKAVTDYDRKLLGLGADYKLSKNTRLYYRYDNVDYDTGAKATTALGSQQTRNAIGVSTKF